MAGERRRPRTAAALLASAAALAALALAPQRAGAAPLDGRAFELVSPPAKEGGAIAAPGGLFGGAFQAAAGGNAITYSSPNAFAEPAGAPPASQYLSRRSSSGWSTENISQPLQSGAYGEEPDGSPYKLFSADLSRALLEDPRRCEVGEPCPRGYSLRASATGALTALPAEAAGMRVLSAAPDLSSVLFETEAAEVFEWSGGGVLEPAEAPSEPEPVSGIVGVLGASTSGHVVYYQDAEGLKRWREGTVTTIAAGADAAAPSDWPAATGTARVSADGAHLLFLSAATLGGYDNTDALSGEADTELYLYGPSPGGGSAQLHCISCNPSGERPEGSSWIPGAEANGTTHTYKPRVLSASGNRVFFESADDLAPTDTDSRPDVYEWEAGGEGSCTASSGCLGLVSSGVGEGAHFLDASASGADVYFLTEDSLVKADPGSIDVYDARAGGGLPEPQAPFSCVGDLCQPLPAAPEDPTPGTLLPSSGNPAARLERERRGRACPKGKLRRRGRCAAKHRRKHHHHHQKKRAHR